MDAMTNVSFHTGLLLSMMVLERQDWPTKGDDECTHGTYEPFTQRRRTSSMTSSSSVDDARRALTYGSLAVRMMPPSSFGMWLPRRNSSCSVYVNRR